MRRPPRRDRVKLRFPCAASTALATVLAVVCIVVASGAAWADSYQVRRLRTGARLFGALLAADEGLPEKVGEDGQLLILFFCGDDRTQAEALANEVFPRSSSESAASVRGLPVRIEFVGDPAFTSYRERTVAGVFLVAAPPDRELRQIIRFAIDHHVVLFSPHEGDVEKGVLGGLIIEAQVLPCVNITTARESEISIKQFFLKVAKVVESP